MFLIPQMQQIEQKFNSWKVQINLFELEFFLIENWSLELRTSTSQCGPKRNRKSSMKYRFLFLAAPKTHKLLEKLNIADYFTVQIIFITILIQETNWMRDQKMLCWSIWGVQHWSIGYLLCVQIINNSGKNIRLFDAAAAIPICAVMSS